MTTDDILRMAREAGRWATNQTGDTYEWNVLRDERFAALVAAAEREARQAAQVQVAELQERLNRADAERCAAVLAEREECAKVCDTTPPQPFRPSIEAAHAIRARGKT